MKVLVVGAGFYGATFARVMADAGHEVAVFERKDQVGGHCRTSFHPTVGCFVHDEGPHIFHTSNPEVWAFANRFAEFNGFINRPKVSYGNQLFSFPINLMTLYQLWGVTTPEQARKALERRRSPIENPRNMEEWALANIGPELYSIFIEGYTTKQWGKHPRELPASILKRVPVRLTYDDNYFTDPYQGIPFDGYTHMVERMLDHRDIGVELGMEYERGDSRAYDLTIYTGAIDEFFGYELGYLEYRTIEFQSQVLDVADYQGNAVVNYTDLATRWTRVVEHKHFEPRAVATKRTIITREFSGDWAPGLERHYPVPSEKNQVLYESYKSKAPEGVIFGGRLGEYTYRDMDATIAAALGRARECLAR